MPQWPLTLLVDDAQRDRFLPLAFTRPLAHFRFGIRTIQEKWNDALNMETGILAHTSLQVKFPVTEEQGCILIKARICPSEALIQSIENLEAGQNLVDSEGGWLARRCAADESPSASGFEDGPSTTYSGEYLGLDNLWELFQKLGDAIADDFASLNQADSGRLSSTNTVIGDHPVYLAPGAKAEASIFNTSNGPVYIGPDAEVMEGCQVRGPFAMGAHSVLKMGAKIYGATAFGPQVKVGGEVNNSLIFGYSNKGHDGFLGNSVLGEWCNLGADTNNSNLKNNYGIVKLWDYASDALQPTGLQFCGLIMGDHSKAGINTMFNTGTVVGVSANVFGGGFPPKFIPSFSWGGAESSVTYRLDKAMEVAGAVMARRQVELSNEDRQILANIFELTAGYRSADQS